MSSTQDAVNFKFPNKFRIGVKEAMVLVIAIGGVGITGFWLYSDRHNDERYVAQNVYDKDQRSISEKLDKMDKNQEEMQKDIKEILKKK
jgi:hypothetical protein